MHIKVNPYVEVEITEDGEGETQITVRQGPKVLTHTEVTERVSSVYVTEGTPVYKVTNDLWELDAIVERKRMTR